MAWIRKFLVNQRDSLMRGTKRKCLPRNDPPKRPVTNRSSPFFPPAREIQRPFSTKPVTPTEMTAGPRVALVSPPTMPTSKRDAARCNPR
ncbi:MAG: hypothetical protein DMF18_03240 [Verrucomicrobia bacterium]|nr:MAG: hypothetical protein DMF18_03240 [Verrucomicrobiota bacterium]